MNIRKVRKGKIFTGKYKHNENSRLITYKTSIEIKAQKQENKSQFYKSDKGFTK